MNLSKCALYMLYLFFIIGHCLSGDSTEKDVSPSIIGPCVTSGLSTRQSFLADCSSKNLHEIPGQISDQNITILDLQNNSIREIKPNGLAGFGDTLQVLDLSRNLLESFHKNTFSGLVKLSTLKIGHNKLCLHFSFPEGLFKDLISLNVLYTLGNKCPTHYHRSYPDKTFKDLSSLQKISLDLVYSYNLNFGQGFENLKNLSSFETSYLSQPTCYQARITNTSFYHLRNLPISELTLRGCAYNRIESGSLKHFPQLATLNAACTRNLKSTELFTAINEMQRPSLKTLILDGSILSELVHFCHKNFENIERLSIRNVRSNSLTKNIKPTNCLPKLDHINLAGNPFLNVMYYYKKNRQTTEYILENGFPKDTYLRYQSIKTVDVSFRFDGQYAFSNKYCKETEQPPDEYFRKVPEVASHISYSPNITVNSRFVKAVESNVGTDLSNISEATIVTSTLSPRVQNLFIDHWIAGISWDISIFTACPFLIYPPDQLAYFNLSHNNLQRIRCPFLGMYNLRVFDCTSCRLREISIDMVKQKYSPNVEILNLGDNFLGVQVDNFPEIFSEALKLRSLDLSKNYIETLPYNSFENLHRIEELQLSHNLITSSLYINISQLSTLKLLDLSFNQIEKFSSKFSSELDVLNSNSKKFNLKMDGNPFSCSCDSTAFLDWFQNTKVMIMNKQNLKCHESSLLLIDINTGQLLESCDTRKKYFIIIGILLTLLLLVGLVAFLVYRYRWKIAWHVYTFRQNWCKNEKTNKTEFDMKNKVYDGFLAYALDDDAGRKWAITKLLPYVEKELGKQLYIFDRDSVVGNSRIGEIIHGMQHSSKTIFVVTTEFFTHYEWEMVMYWAVRRGLDSIVLCCLDGFTIEKMPPAFAKIAFEIQEKFPTHYLEFMLDEEIETMIGADEVVQVARLVKIQGVL